MSLETKKKESAPTVENPLAVLGIDNPLATAMEAERKEFLPYIKVAWGIEDLSYTVMGNDGKPLKVSASHKLVISGGGDVQPVPDGSLMTVIIGRGATRELVPGKDGKQSYKRTYASLKGAENNKPEHTAQLARFAAKDKNVQCGNAYLVAILNPAEGEPKTCVLGLLEAFKTQQQYWETPCNAAVLKDGFGIKLGITDHQCNLTASKANPVNKYYDPRKHNQYQQVKLTPAQVKLVSATLREHSAAVDAWLTR